MKHSLSYLRTGRTITSVALVLAIAIGSMALLSSDPSAVDTPALTPARESGAPIANEPHESPAPKEQETQPRQRSIGPSLRVGDSAFDFGVVPVGCELKQTFVLHNDGDLPLEIQKAKPSCGCAALNFDRVIPAGGQGLFEVKISAKSVRPGKLQQHIEVESSQPSFWLITISATVDPNMQPPSPTVHVDDVGLLGR